MSIQKCVEDRDDQCCRAFGNRLPRLYCVDADVLLSPRDVCVVAAALTDGDLRCSRVHHRRHNWLRPARARFLRVADWI